MTGPVRPTALPESFWRSLQHLNRFRFFLAVFFVCIPLYGELPLLGKEDPRLFMSLGALYGGLTWGFGRMQAARRLSFGRQLFLHVLTDVLFITVLMHLSGGNESGLGLLIIVPMAAAGLHPRARLMLLMASLGALAILLEQLLQQFWWHGGTDGFMQAGLLATGFFTVSGFSHVLAKGALSAAQLAGEKSAQADSMAQVNSRIIQELQDGVLVVDRDGLVIQHNARAEELLECRVFGNARLNHCSPVIIGLWKTWQASGRNPEAPLVTGREGRRLRVRFTELEPSRATGAVIVLEDMTELEHEARNMKLAALGRLTANLAHEIRNPLAAIQQAAALLAEEPATATMGRLAHIIEDNTQRLNGLVEDVLSLNRRDRLQLENIRLAAFLRDFIAQVEQSEQIEQGVIALTAAEQLCIRFDRLHLTQILWNLVRNAWRHCTRDAGSIQIRGIAAEGLVTLEVFNNGEPISAEMQARLFEPFYTTDKRGTGLGLYIARELADANGGSLCYVDQAGGALFRIACRAVTDEECR